MSPQTVRTSQRWLGAALGVVLAVTSAVEAQAQLGQVSGRIVNSADGQPVAAAQVIVQGTTLQVLSGQDGSYTLQNVPVGTRTLIVQRIGFQTLNQANVTVSAGQTTVLQLTLVQQALQLDAIVATGLVDPVSGRQSPITVGRVDRENMPNPVAGSMIQNLQGQVAGVTVARGSGQPGSDAEILLRSPTIIGGAAAGSPSTEPLIVVDGVIQGASTVNLESMDILSIEVVKGAAAASMYGSRANNGVIAITTNRGAGLAQGQTQFTFRSEYGWQEAIKGTNLNTHHGYAVDDPANPTTYVCVTQANCDIWGNLEDDQPGWAGPAYVNGTYTPGSPVGRVRREFESPGNPSRIFFDNIFPTQVYDNINGAWNPGTYQQHTLNLAQNTVDTNFFLSLNRNVETGPLPNNDGYSRNAFRLNLDHRFMNTLSLSVSTFHSRDVRDNVNGSLTSLYTMARDVDITARPVTQEDSIASFCGIVTCRYNKNADLDGDDNPLWVEAVRQDDRRSLRTQGSASLRWEPASWLNLTGTASYDRQDVKTENYLPAGILVGSDLNGSLSFAQSLSDNWNADAQMQLRRQFGDLNARMTIRGSMERGRNESLSGGGNEFLFPGLPNLEAMNQTGVTSSSSVSETRANGYLADLAADYQGKYIGTVLFRRDGSSLFGREERWQNYYRVAGNWRISEEDWFTLPLDELSVRVSRGTAGGRPGFSAQYEVWNLSNGAVSKGQLGNRFLKPSHTLEHDVTLTAVVGRWEVIGTYAWQETKDQIRSVDLPGYFGYPSQWMNLGALEGESLELTVNGRVMQTQNFQWSTTVVADRSNSVITSWPRPLACSGVEAWRFRCEGRGVYEIWGRHFVDSQNKFNRHQDGGLVADADQFMRNDDGMYVWVGSGVDYRDGPGVDGIVGTGDDLWGTQGTVNGTVFNWGIPFELSETGVSPRYELGDARHVNVGWINNFRYGAFTVFTQMNAKIGGDLVNTGHQSLAAAGNAPQTDQFGRPEGLKKPQFYWQTVGCTCSYFTGAGSYVKLRQLSVNYRVQPTQLARFGLSNAGVTGLQVGVIARNLWMWTNYDGWDPEAGLSLSGGAQTSGNTQYPPSKTYTVEFQLTF